MGADKSPQRRTVCFSGRVQGVGFRYTARSVALRFDVTGYVRNQHDGSVELVAEGRPDQLDGFLRLLRNEMGRHIRDERCDVQPATGEFTAFEIRH
jgi:acylphosphatase